MTFQSRNFTWDFKMRANLLGLGPSLANFNFGSTTEDIINITFNAGIFEERIINVSDWIVVHDTRFIRHDYLTTLSDLKKTKVASFGKFEENLKINPKLVSEMLNNNIISEFWYNLVDSELLLNVVVDFGIPFAAHLGAREINLYGCDFNYFMDENGNADYYDDYSKEFDFDHNTTSHKHWSSRSFSRLKEAMKLFSQENITINWHNDGKN